MALDRDLGVAVARALAEERSGRPISGWDMLAGTGIRTLRMLGDSPLFGDLVLSERNVAAFQVLGANCARFPMPRVRAVMADCVREPQPGPFGYVDLDPYGSPLPYLSTLFGAAEAGTTIAVTATDLRVLGGADSAACLRRYGARPVRGHLGMEGGLRVLLAVLSRAAGDRGLSIRPRLAYVLGHSIRAYVALADAATEDPPVNTIDPTGFEGPELGVREPVGPLWTGPLLDESFVGRLRPLDTASDPAALARLIARLREEANVPGLFFFEANELSRRNRLSSPPALDRLFDSLRAAGWEAVRTHVRPEGFRTLAPRREVERIAAELDSDGRPSRPPAARSSTS